MTEKGDSKIFFDEKGVCNYCTQAYSRMDSIYFPNSIGKAKLDELIQKLKSKNKEKPYDCLMGISGGLDSSYLAYLGAVKWGLRIAAIHIDDGFDTEVSKRNIKTLCEKCGIDIQIIRPNEEQFNELCRAYLLAGVPNLAVPQDNILFSEIYKFAKKNNVREFLSGSNFSLECILQESNTYRCFDVINIRSINKKFGRQKIDKLPLMSDWRKMYDSITHNVVTYAPLNYIKYERETALKELAEFCNFEYYGSKHLENYYTGFLQLYWLPQKWGVDKRTSHLSSMIITGQITREAALQSVQSAPCSEEWLSNAIKIIKDKLSLSDEEFDNIMSSETHKHEEYCTDFVARIIIRILRWRRSKR